MKTLHIDTYEIGQYPNLCELLDVHPELENAATGDNSIEEQMSDYWYDCDYVKLDGEDGRGNHSFIDVKVPEDDTRYIIHLSEYEYNAAQLIDWWLAGADGALPIENTWHDWETVRTGVAYRGGSGYCYALYAKELN